MAVAVTQDDAAREAWLRERKKGIGASEVGTILGLNPYESPYELYLHKRDDLPPKSETLAMWLGHEMEPIIAKRYEMETGRFLHDPGDFTILPHPDYPWLRSTLDRTTVFEDDRRGPVEFKAPMSGYFDEDGNWCPPQSHHETWLKGEAPLTAQAQLQIQLACGNFEVGEIVAMIGNSEFIILRYERNYEFLDAIIPVLHEFYERIQTGDPPPVDGSESTTKALRALHPLDNGNTIQLPLEYAHKIRVWQNLAEEAKAIDRLLKTAKNELIAAIGDNTFAVADGVKISYKAQTRAGYEVKPTTFRTLRKVGK